QINPALGAINYTPYLQGSLAGSQAIGQGIANLGQGIASGIEQYQKQKKENQAIDAKIKENNTLFESLKPVVDKLPPQFQQIYSSYAQKIHDPNLSRVDQLSLSEGGVKALSQIMNLGMQTQEQQTALESQNRIASAALALSGEGMGPVPAANRAAMLLQQGYTPSQVVAAQELFGKSEAQRAGTEKTIAEASSVGKKAPTPFSVSYNAFKAQYPNATPEQELAFIQQNAALNRPTTNIINTPENSGKKAAEEGIGKAVSEQYIAIGSAADSAENAASTLNRVKDLYKQGAYSGTGANIVSSLKSLAASLGYDTKDATTQDQLNQILQENALMRTRELFKGLGSLSNLEGQKAESTVANLSRTPEGNVKILEWQSRNAPVLRAADDLKL
ncbi:MAG: hypothetical protein EBR82_83780, partial [Caulobacteraceae bacterium]|nr:hypothetical protein [Caulobacteraceae bacterium]